MSTEREQFLAVERAIQAAFDAGDATTVASHYHKDGVQFLPLLKPIRGRLAVQSTFEGMLRSSALRREVECLGVEMSASGDYAVTHGTANISGWEHPGVGGLISYTSIFATIYQKEGGGKWEVILSIISPSRMERDSRGAPNLPEMTLGMPATGAFNFRPSVVYDWVPKLLSLEIKREKELLRKLHESTDAGITALKADEFVKFYREDAQLITAGAPVAKGLQRIQELATEVFSLPNFSLPIRYYDTIVSHACDLAFTYGEISMRVEDRWYPGDYCIVYRKTDGGEWRGLIDITCPPLNQPGLFPNH